MWSCMPTRPGISVCPLPSITVASFGTCTCLPTAAIKPSRSSTVWFSCAGVPLPSITHLRVIDGSGTPAQENQTVLLRDGLIAAVGKHVQVPKDATVIDGSGQTLIPGLVGMHDHMFYPAPKVNPLAKEAIY